MGKHLLLGEQINDRNLKLKYFPKFNISYLVYIYNKYV